METKNKIKKTLFLALLAVALLLAPSVANAKEECDPDSTFYDTCKAAEGEQFGHDEKGVIGGALNVAGNSIGDALGWAFGDLGGEGRLPTSFIDFQGGLQPPEGSGLAPELTRAKTAREFIVNIINFVLSFLGLLAVIMIIYGGFLYVTAGGVEEQSTKGKKSLQYAVIGILIVLMSFAVVNTLIRSAPTGGDDRGEIAAGEPLGGPSGGSVGGGIISSSLEGIPGGGIRGAAPTLDGITQQRIYNLAGLEIRSSAQQFANAYQLYTGIHGGIQAIRVATAPQNGNEARGLLREIETFLKSIQSRTDPLTHTHRAARRFFNDFVQPNLELTGRGLESLFSFNPTQAQAAVVRAQGFGGAVGSAGEEAADAATRAARGVSDAIEAGVNATTESAPFKGDAFKTALIAALDESALETANKFDFVQLINKFVLPKEVSQDPQVAIPEYPEEVRAFVTPQVLGTLDPGTLVLLEEALGPIIGMRPEEIAQDSGGVTSIEDLQRALENIRPDFTVGDAFKETIDSFKTARSVLLEEPDAVDHIVKISKDLQRLYTMVRDIKFVSARINSTAREGNAPFAVQFDSLGSIDPSGKTITDADGPQHFWDLNGNGTFEDKLDDNDFTCEELHAATVTCVYKNPGTYRVSLSIKSSEPQFAAGLAYMTVVVHPPRSRIHLEAKAQGTTEVLQGYDEAGRRIIDKASFRMTTEEAKVGAMFDASKSTDSGGVSSGLVNFEWSFGDGSDSVRGQKIIENHQYKAIGTYRLTLEVTDRGGVKDRKIVDVVVSAIAARIYTPTLRGDLNTPFEFDGSHSKSDVGQIDSYEWKVTDEGGKELDDVKNNTSDTLRYTFKNPGKYTVTLTVIDKIGNTDTTNVEVLIESQAPQAVFEVAGCFDDKQCFDQTQPALVKLNAAKSFDPDEADTLGFRWEVVGETEKIDYAVVKGNMGTDDKGDSEVHLKFLKKGEHTIKLTVSDQHEDSEIRRSDTAEKTVDIKSVVDLKWDEDMFTALKLQNGTVTFPIKAAAVFPGRSGEEGFTYTIKDDKGNEIATEETLPKDGLIVEESVYTSAGAYVLELTASSPEHGSTTIKKRIYVAGGDEPLPIIIIRKDGIEVFNEPDEPIEILRFETLEFEGEESLDSEGTKALTYSWNFDDRTSSKEANPKHKYDNISPKNPGFYEVRLTVSDTDVLQKKNPQRQLKSAEATVRVNVVSAKPTVQALSIRRTGDQDVTPVDVEVTAENPKDVDGHIREYKFYYYDVDDPETKLGVVRKDGEENNKTTLTVETYGESGATKKYLFCVEIKDDENNTVPCDELFEEDTLPFLEVSNGANQAPKADFSMNRSLVKVGESVQFTAKATDPDGRIVEYIWDVEGDGFQNDAPSELSQITYTFETPSPEDGFQVQLKVTDDLGATAVSETKPVHVGSAFEPPIADFTWQATGRGTAIRFTNTSRPAPGSPGEIVSYKWDFSVEREFFCNTNLKRCDHDMTNDIDSSSKDPIFEYPEPGIYKVRLTVEDSNGQIADIITEPSASPKEPKDVEVILDEASADQPIEAHLKTEPPEDVFGRVRLQGDGQNVNFLFGESRGDIKEYRLDYNIYYDTGTEKPDDRDRCNPPEGQVTTSDESGDGCRDDDSDFPTTDGSEVHTKRYLRNFTTHHPKCYITAKLTVIGENAQGLQIRDTDTIDIFFDIPPPMPNCFKTNASASDLGAANISDKINTNTAILLGLVGGAILALIGYWISIFGQRGKPRNI